MSATQPQGIYIPKHIAEDISCHLRMYDARRIIRTLPVAPIYALVGPSGTGKTTTGKAVAEALDAYHEVVPASALAGPYAGQSSIPVRDAIIRAAASPKWMSVVQIDDLDMTEARVDENLSGTINTALLNAMLMAFGDNPFQLTINDEPDNQRIVPIERPPLILITCNDMTKIHAPLVRDGRVKHATLDPRGKSAVPIVRAMYPHSKPTDIEQLVAKYPNETVAFFKQLGMVVAEKFVKEALRANKIGGRDFDNASFASAISEISQGAVFEDLVKAAQQLSKVERRKNYLKDAA